MGAILHLAHPLQAYNSLFNLQYAWLSREILMAVCYGAIVATAFLSGGNRVTAILASGAGLLLVVVQGMTYAATAMVAVAGGITLMMFLLATMVAGYAATPLVNGGGALPGLKTGLIAFMVIQLAAPLSWLNGGVVMRQTGIAWLSSPLYVVSLLCLSVAVLAGRNLSNKWLFCLILTGLLFSRLVFFGETISLADNIGELY
ncbi:TPA: dimethyl sulfoxide reductase anchor subunit [Escherichia coli]|nr:dimethyl sulfoxide reductase anchor subunit [Escherichia coli]HBB0297973.1 dimethyl sulfoxide reductase anchor subunit [Escherichia coli]